MVVSLTLTTSVHFYGLSPIAVLRVCGNALHFGDYFCNIKNFTLYQHVQEQKSALVSFKEAVEVQCRTL